MVHPFEIETTHSPEKAIRWPMASVFLIGHSAGAGMLAMPLAFAAMGIEIGTVLALLCATFSLNTGLQLGWMWQSLQEMWPEYRKTCQNPYGEIAFRAFGLPVRMLTEAMILFAQLGYAVVLLLLAAKNASVLAHFFLSVEINQCYLILIVALIVWPSTMLRSPAEFWQIALISAASSWATVGLLVFGILHDAPTCSRDVPHEPIDLFKSFMTYGSLVFAYGAHPCFPTIQHDMKKPSHFSRSLIVAWVIITVFYLIISYLGYFVYGNTVGATIISSVQHPTIQQLVNLMLAIHVASTIILAASPAFQQSERLLKVPHPFSVKRFCLRSSIFLMVTFTALTFPHFGPLIDIMGASVHSLIAMVFPSAFYLSLRTFQLKRKQDKKREDFPTIAEIIESTPKPILLFNIVSMCFGLIAAVIATVSAIRTFSDASLPPPCYIQYIRSGLPFSSPNGGVNCCGTHRNLTVYDLDPNGFCMLHNA